jgi:ribosomal protein S18 acetylase RimI-like enzyme
MGACIIRAARAGDEPGAFRVCLETGDHGQDAQALYREDPDALGRIYVGPYLAFETELSLMLEDDQGICGYALAARDSRAFYARYEADWRPRLCERFPAPDGDPRGWTPVQRVYHSYHHPDYFCPDPYESYPAHLHIDLLPRAQGLGYGRRMIEQVLAMLGRRGCPGTHLGLSALNTRAFGFYQHLGFHELTRASWDGDEVIYMGRRL